MASLGLAHSGLGDPGGDGEEAGKHVKVGGSFLSEVMGVDPGMGPYESCQPLVNSLWMTALKIQSAKLEEGGNL